MGSLEDSVAVQMQLQGIIYACQVVSRELDSIEDLVLSSNAGDEGVCIYSTMSCHRIIYWPIHSCALQVVELKVHPHRVASPMATL